MSARLRIGLLVEALANPFWNELVLAVESAARRRAVDLFVFVGGALDVPDAAAQQANICYELPSPDNLDGLIVLPLGAHAGAERLEQYVQRYPGLAVAGLTAILSNVPSVCVDNLESMHRAVSHLVEVHGARRIAFIQGPKNNAEAELRYRGYRRALIGHNIKQDPELVFRGDFLAQSGARAARALLDSGKPFDALVAANDEMALGALGELHARSVRVPKQALVVGFDDVPEGRWGRPSLTTIRQPYAALAEAALERVLAQLEGLQVPALSFLPGELVARESCACRSPLGAAVAAPLSEPRASGAPGSAERALALRGVVPSGVEQLPEDWGVRLVEGVEADLRGADRGFVDTLVEQVQQAARSKRDLGDWQNVVSRLRQAFGPFARQREKRWRLAEELFLRGRISLGEAAERQQATLRRQSEALLYEAIGAGSDVLGNFGEDPLFEALSQRLPRMQLRSCYLSLYEADRRWPPPRSRLVFAYKDGARLDVEHAAASFATKALVPSGFRSDERKTFVVAPLFFAEEQLGLLLLEFGPPQGELYDWVREQLSVALEGARLVRRVGEEVAQRERAERAGLEQELDVAKRIQSALLPQGLEVRGLELAGRVMPAAEVGGDGYDVRPFEGGAWISLGQVSGHGLRPGMVMMMLQSSVAAVVTASPEASPREVIAVANAVLSDSTREWLGEAEHALLLALRYESTGHVVYAGAGEDIVIYRARLGRAERIEPRGVLVGALDDVAGAVPPAELLLEPGDVMLLYTDGVVAARSADAEPFGVERLMAELERLHAEPVERIRDGLIAYVLEWAKRQEDDLTVLVARQR
jgi:DNA-binding LacI/PurR family transcriptional regulator/serine phosphatase RsbU (regulator of sigma subunit)